jgi:hypothetical protein
MKKLLVLLVLTILPASPMENAKNLLLTAAKEIGTDAGIFATTFGATCLYGIAHDQIAVRVCPEYFSQGYKKEMRNNWTGPVLGKAKEILQRTKSPTIVGLIWGPIDASYLGTGLAIVATLNTRLVDKGLGPQLGVQDLAKPLAVTLAITGATALIAGAIGYIRAGDEEYRKPFRTARLENFVLAMSGVPKEAERGFIANMMANKIVYKIGCSIAGLGLISYLLAKRYSMK